MLLDYTSIIVKLLHLSVATSRGYYMHILRSSNRDIIIIEGGFIAVDRLAMQCQAPLDKC